MALSILLVEDDPIQAEVLRNAFAAIGDGHRIEHRDNGTTGLDYLRGPGRKPDLVITDLLMPSLDGVGLLRAMKEDADLRAIPVIVLTGSPQHASVLSAYDLQAMNVFQKPNNLHELRRLVRMIVDFVANGQRGGRRV